MGHFVWRLARRPQEIVEATRWLFALLVLLTLLFTLPVILSSSAGSMLLAGLVSALVLGLSWTGGYLRRTAPWWMDLVDSVAFVGFGLAGPDPMASIGLVMPALWFRSLYGSARRAVLRAGLYAAAVLGSLQIWANSPGQSVGAGPLLGVIPAMFLTVVASRQLAGGLRARSQATQRDAIHMSVGAELLGLTDAAEIRRIAWVAMAGICAATPGLRVLKVVREEGALRVDGATGGFAVVPATLPAAVVDLLEGDHVDGDHVDGDQVSGDQVSGDQVTSDEGAGAATVHRHPELDKAAGAECVWACVPLPWQHAEHGSGWLLLGSPRKVSDEAMVAVGTLTNQVTLALHNGEVHEKLTLLAELDSLTGLANRASFNTALSLALADASSPITSVLFIDLDDFKDVNDLLGHGTGDGVLREVAERLRRFTRPGDLCARLGGDEFAVLLRGTAGDGASDIAHRMVGAVGAPIRIGGSLVRVGASIGVAEATCDTDREQVIHQADVAMYAAKAKGKARIQVFEPGLLRVDSSQVMLERQLALAADHGELEVHYQPIMSAGGRCTAVEALVRWRHPKRGLLYPDAFIETAERIGAIGDLGAFVLRRACADTATWRDAHPASPLSIHVNISALQLDDDGFVDVVMGCLTEFGPPRSCSFWRSPRPS